MLGTGPDECYVDELTILFYGGLASLILRPGGKEDYRLAREAYIHGVMDGETYDDDPAFEALLWSGDSRDTCQHSYV